jgi:hypothetical protein
MTKAGDAGNQGAARRANGMHAGVTMLAALAFIPCCGGNTEVTDERATAADANASCASEGSGRSASFGASPIACPDSYDGPAHVAERTGTALRLEFGDEVDGAVPTIEVTAASRSILDRLALPDRVWLNVRGGERDFGGSVFVVARASEDGKLLFIVHNDDLRFYEAGLFDSKELAGVRLTVAERCSYAVSDGCFKNEVHTLFDVTVEGDDTIALPGTGHGVLAIEGSHYDLWVGAGRVDGESPSHCTDTWPHSYLDFTILPVGVSDSE